MAFVNSSFGLIMGSMLHKILLLIYDFRSRGDSVPIEDFALLERDFARKLGLRNFDWVRKEDYSPTHLPTRPLSSCRVALVSTAGIYQRGQKPFALRLSGDASFRLIDGEKSVAELRARHGGYDGRRAGKDLNCLFPLDRLHELVAAKRVESASKRHISFMGYVPYPTELEEVIAPRAGQILIEDGVDLVLLSPA